MNDFQDSYPTINICTLDAQRDDDELNDLVRDLGLSKELSELLASRLNEKNMLYEKTKVTFYRNRERELF